MTDPNSSGRKYPEVTLSAVLFAIIIGVVMNAAVTYSGLKIGFTITGSAIAAVLGFGVLRGILRRGTILETNIAQTVASGINTSNSGIIFTVPVLILMGSMTFSLDSPDFWLITFATVAGALLGTAFIVPLRKQMLDIDRLRFPSPTGVASILKSPGAGPAKAKVLVLGMALGALIYLPAGMPALRFEAQEEEFDELFAAGNIGWADVERSRAIAGWIEAGAAPAEYIQRGGLVAERTRLIDELDRRKTAGEDTATTEAAIASVDERLEALPALPIACSDGLVAAAYAASQGGAEWSTLRDRKLGWASKPLPGYSSVGWTMANEVDASGPQIDRNGDGQPDAALTRRVDRNQDSRPDPILTDTSVDVGRALGFPDYLQLIFAIAPFALGAGFITGRAGLFVLAGGILAFFVLNPIAFSMGWLPESVRADQAPGFAFGSVNRPLGIGLLLGGALMGVLASLPAIKEALKSIGSAGKAHGGSDELGFKTLFLTAGIAMVLLYLTTLVISDRPINKECPVTSQKIESQEHIAQFNGYAIAMSTADALTQWEAYTDEERTAAMEGHNIRPGWLAGFPPWVRSLLIAIIGAGWMWFAGIIIAQCAGMTDWSPISGMALLTVVLVMTLAGTGAEVGAVLIGAALCVAITLASDMMGDLKTGYLVGSKPKRQQITEVCVVSLGPVVAMLTLVLLVQANLSQGGPAMGPGSPLGTEAPQAQALEAVIRGMQGDQMPYALYGLGALVGALLGMCAFPGLGVLVGLSMYLPFQYIATYGIGCVVNILLAKWKGRNWAEEWGVPFAAGLIVGESVLALLINGIVVVRG